MLLAMFRFQAGLECLSRRLLTVSSCRLFHIVSDGDPAPPLQRDTAPIFGPYLLRPNGCMDQDITWYGARPWPGDFVLDGEPAPPAQKGSGAPNFWSMFIVAKRLDG